MTKTLSQRSIEEIIQEIDVTLKAIDKIVNEPIKPDTPNDKGEKEISHVDGKRIGELEDAIDNLEDTVAFFEEKKKILVDFRDISEDDFNALDTEKKTIILQFVYSSYDEPEAGEQKDPQSISREELSNAVAQTLKDIDIYIENTTVDMTKIKEGLVEEEERYQDVERDLLKKEIEEGSKAAAGVKAAVEKRKEIFNNEIEKLKILEEELRLAMIDEANSSQIDNIRTFLREKS